MSGRRPLRAAAFAIAAVVAGAGCGSTYRQDLDQQTVVTSQQSGVATPRFVEIRDAGDWASLWAQHVAPQSPPPPLPPVDFTTRMLVGVFLGQRPNGCHDVRIEAVEAFGSSFIRVSWRERVPAAAAVCPAVLTQPMHVVSVVRINLPIEFFELPAATVGGP